MFTLVDSGATRSFINRDLVLKRKIPMLCLPCPLKAQNIDGTHNSGGIIWHKVSIFVWISNAKERREFLVLNCRKENMILGPWAKYICQAFLNDPNMTLPRLLPSDTWSGTSSLTQTRGSHDYRRSGWTDMPVMLMMCAEHKFLRNAPWRSRK
jgi:hypothetical protein